MNDTTKHTHELTLTHSEWGLLTGLLARRNDKSPPGSRSYLNTSKLIEKLREHGLDRYFPAEYGPAERAALDGYVETYNVFDPEERRRR